MIHFSKVETSIAQYMLAIINMIYFWELIVILVVIFNGIILLFVIWNLIKNTRSIFVIFKKTIVYIPGEWNLIFYQQKPKKRQVRIGNKEEKMLNIKRKFVNRWPITRDSNISINYLFKLALNTKMIYYKLLIVFPTL